MSSTPPSAPVTSPPLPPTSPPPNSSNLPPPPSTSQPSDASAPPPQSSQATPAAPPPSTPVQPEPVLTPPLSAALPPSPPASPPPSPPIIPPPAVTSPPPSIPSPPSPVVASPPPQPSPSVRAATPPPISETVPLSPPPPADSPPTPPLKPKPPKASPLPTVTTPPPSESPPSPLDSSPPPASPSPPQAVPSASLPPAGLPLAPPSSNGSATDSPVLSPLPVLPTEKPTARPTEGNKSLGSTTPSHSGGLNTSGAILVGIGVGFLVLSLLVFAVWYVKKRRKRDLGTTVGYGMPSMFSSPQSSEAAFLKPHYPAPHLRSGSGSNLAYSPSDSGVMSSQRSWFTYEELAHATNGFSERNILGEGGFGCVYKGILMDGREVAVKQLKIGGSQGEREFQAEVEIITRVHHRHLVSLVGYCIMEHQRLLVYDYVPNNTLHYHLHDQGRPVMAWETRVKVAAGAARGIAYLHEDCHPRIIHRDIKSSNILLDNNFEARVSDFGLAKIAQELDSNTHISTRVMGTFGYMAPEYATSGKLTEKSDVYSYGVVLLELITGRKPVDASRPLGDESLVEWARPLLSQAIEREDFNELMDPRLGNNYVPIEMFRMIEAAAACVRHSATKRPRMSQVVRALDTLEEATDITNGMKPGQSQIFDSAQQSAQIRMFQRMAFGSQDYSSEIFNQSQSSWRSRDYGTRDFGSREQFNRSNYIP